MEQSNNKPPVRELLADQYRILHQITSLYSAYLAYNTFQNKEHFTNVNKAELEKLLEEILLNTHKMDKEGYFQEYPDLLGVTQEVTSHSRNFLASITENEEIL